MPWYVRRQLSQSVWCKITLLHFLRSRLHKSLLLLVVDTVSTARGMQLYCRHLFSFGFTSSLPEGETLASHTYPATTTSATVVRCYFFVRIPRCIVAGIVLGNARNKRSYRTIRTIHNDVRTYVKRNDAFAHRISRSFCAWHVYSSGCRDEIYGSDRCRVVEAAWDLLAYSGACRYFVYSSYCTIAKIVPPCMLMAVYVDHIDG